MSPHKPRADGIFEDTIMIKAIGHAAKPLPQRENPGALPTVLSQS